MSEIDTTPDERAEAAERRETWLAEQARLLTLEDGFDG